MLTQTNIGRVVLVWCVWFGLPVQSNAQPYPSRPIRFIVPFPPGGSTDIYARILAPKLAESLKQQVVVDNRAGAGGALGAELAAASPADGYTIWMGQTNNLAIGPAMRKKSSYDAIRDFSPITLLMEAAQIVVVNAGSPITSLKDLIAAAKSQPGKLSYASGNATGAVAGEMLKQAAGIEIFHVPYKNAPQALNDVAGNTVSMMFNDITGATPAGASAASR